MGIIVPFLPILQEIKKIREILFMKKRYMPQIPACTMLPYAAAMVKAPRKSQKTWGPFLAEL